MCDSEACDVCKAHSLRSHSPLQHREQLERGGQLLDD